VEANKKKEPNIKFKQSGQQETKRRITLRENKEWNGEPPLGNPKQAQEAGVELVQLYDTALTFVKAKDVPGGPGIYVLSVCGVGNTEPKTIL